MEKKTSLPGWWLLRKAVEGNWKRAYETLVSALCRMRLHPADAPLIFVFRRRYWGSKSFPFQTRRSRAAVSWPRPPPHRFERTSAGDTEQSADINHTVSGTVKLNQHICPCLRALPTITPLRAFLIPSPASLLQLDLSAPWLL